MAAGQSGQNGHRATRETGNRRRLSLWLFSAPLEAAVLRAQYLGTERVFWKQQASKSDFLKFLHLGSLLPCLGAGPAACPCLLPQGGPSLGLTDPLCAVPPHTRC